jgi:hypothetical protein
MSSIVQIESSLPPSELDHMAEDFYGYGRWDAPFWFIGPEAGMAKTGDSLERRYVPRRMLTSEPATTECNTCTSPACGLAICRLNDL